MLPPVEGHGAQLVTRLTGDPAGVGVLSEVDHRGPWRGVQALPHRDSPIGWPQASTSRARPARPGRAGPASRSRRRWSPAPRPRSRLRAGRSHRPARTAGVASSPVGGHTRAGATAPVNSAAGEALTDVLCSTPFTVTDGPEPHPRSFTWVDNVIGTSGSPVSSSSLMPTPTLLERALKSRLETVSALSTRISSWDARKAGKVACPRRSSSTVRRPPGHTRVSLSGSRVAVSWAVEMLMPLMTRCADPVEPKRGAQVRGCGRPRRGGVCVDGRDRRVARVGRRH